MKNKKLNDHKYKQSEVLYVYPIKEYFECLLEYYLTKEVVLTKGGGIRFNSVSVYHLKLNIYTI